MNLPAAHSACSLSQWAAASVCARAALAAQAQCGPSRHPTLVGVWVAAAGGLSKISVPAALLI